MVNDDINIPEFQLEWSISTDISFSFAIGKTLFHVRNIPVDGNTRHGFGNDSMQDEVMHTSTDFSNILRWQLRTDLQVFSGRG